MTNSELAQLAVTNENTPELGNYWQKRYEKFLKNNVFILSEKTQLLLEQKEPIDSPSTPYGYLNLPIFVGKNKVVDEVMLQNCIETSVRFLDSLLDIIHFTSEAKYLISQNRKIGLGVVNFDEYLGLRDITTKVEEIDYIGEIISSSSYRASEALAEEKGPCENWQNLAFIIRPKAFEYWYNSETGEVKSGLDISEEFTSTNLLSSHFEIIPRRNSHILLYPNDVEWQIWNDRDDNSIINSNLTNESDNGNSPIISTGQDDDNDYMPSFEQQSNSTSQITNDLDLQNESISLDKNHQIPKHEEFINPVPISDLPLINPISTLQKKISTWFAIDPNPETINPQNKVDLSKIHENEIEKTNNYLPVPKVIKDKEVEQDLLPKNVDQFIDKKATEQVVDYKKEEVIKEIQVPIVEIKEVIKEIAKPIFIQIVALSDEAKKILVDNNNNLPTIEYTFQKDIEIEIIEKAQQNFDSKITFMEISSMDVFEEKIYLVYQAKVEDLSANNTVLRYDFIEALVKEQDKIAYSKSIDRIHRWQQSARIKAQELLKEYNYNTQQNQIDNESKIIAQKNTFIEELQVRIQKLVQENNIIEIEKDNIIDDLNDQLAKSNIKLESIQVPAKSIPVSFPNTFTGAQNQTTIKDDQIILVKNDDLAFSLDASKPNQIQSIPTININNHYMTNKQDIQEDNDTNEDTFRTSRDKMFMPTLEIETKLGVPVIIKNNQNDDDLIIDQPKIVENSDPKSSSHAANVLLKLKRLTR